MKNYIITWFYAEKKDDESFYPSVGGNTSSPEFQKVYWKCVYDFYYSALLTQNKSTEYIFFTNVPNIPTDIDGININNFFEKSGIKVMNQDLTTKTPADWYGAWRNQFYVFDVLQNLNKIEGNFVILDSDCIIREDLTKMFEEIEKHGIITYDCGYQNDYTIHGIDHNGMRKLYSEFYGSEEGELLRYKGGEFIGITQSMIEKLLSGYKNLWEMNYKKYINKETKLNEEAHFLSMLYCKNGFVTSHANKYIKRMWTTVSHDNVTRDDAQLAIWHLPAEKKYGFEELYRWFGEKQRTKEEYLKHSSKLMHIPGSPIIRKLKRLTIKVRKNKQVKISK